jgi:tripartite-type tricarboxylate transporter receptor subunit TctC
MPFDPAKDLVPVAAAARIAVYLMAKPALPPSSVREFLKYVKANPGRLSFGSPGNGSSPHLAAEMMKSQAGLYAVHVPYRGAAPALQDLLAGQIDFYFDPGIGLQQAKAGRLKLLAVGSRKRSPLFPDVPTLDEAGLKGFDADTVFGFYAPAGTPAPVVERLNREINRILQARAVQDRIVALGGEALPGSPADFGTRALEDSKRFGAIIRERKIAAD